MTDDFEFLHDDAPLVNLLQHYSPVGPDDREAWRDRLMEANGMAPRDLTRLHGTLLAFALLEQNTGHTPQAEAGQARGCYRLTTAGRRALRSLVDETTTCMP